MTLSEISAETSIPTLRKWEDDCEFWLWNASAEGSSRGAKVWQTRLDAVHKRITEIQSNGKI